MKYSFIPGVIALTVLTACDIALAQDPARAAAKKVVTPIVGETIPSPFDVVVTECVIDNASDGELGTLAAAAVTGVQPETIEAVESVLGRPATIACVEAGLLS